MTVVSAALDRAAAAGYLDMSVGSFERAVREGRAPQPRQLSGRNVAWVRAELDALLRDRRLKTRLYQAGRDDPTPGSTQAAKRRSKRNYAARDQRTPPWADRQAIRRIYGERARISRETGVIHHVDHEIPLQGKFVSGLHVKANLQILPAEQNRRKSNSFAVE